jgi:methylmalonyl-CoA/ethylmalonyl-CoA epimerase
MILRIDHVGVATADPAGTASLLEVLGLARGDVGVAEEYGVACEFWQVPAEAAAMPGGSVAPAVEVVSPVREGSSVAAVLARGPGPYHIAFEVDDVAAELARLRRSGFVPVDRAPCRGARPGMRVAFVYLAKPAGFLIELVQYGDPDHA